MRVWLTITHRDNGLTESYDMTDLYSWHEIIRDHLLAPAYGYEWIISIEVDNIYDHERRQSTE